MPPQHYCDKEVIDAVLKNGFEFLSIRNLINLQIWEESYLKVLPCAKLGERYSDTSPIVFEYWDRIWNTDKFKEFAKIHKNSIPISEHPPSKKPKTKFHMNQELLIQTKKFRDRKKMLKNLVKFL